jgi:hypothetical protein
MRTFMILLATGFMVALLSTGTTPIAPIGPAYAKKCSKAACLSNCGGRGQKCALKCNFCERP